MVLKLFMRFVVVERQFPSEPGEKYFTKMFVELRK